MSEENKPTPQSEADKEKELAAKRNAFLRYMTIIFAVAFLLVLISLVLQAHTAKAALSDLKESNSSALSNAAVNAELLQDENRKLQEELDSTKKLLADEQEKRRKLEEENAFLSVKANYYDRILQSKNSVPVTQIAKDYGMTAIAFNRMLHDYGIQYSIRNSWVLYAEYANLGYTQSKTYQIGDDNAIMHTCWTQAGRIF